MNYYKAANIISFNKDDYYIYKVDRINDKVWSWSSQKKIWELSLLHSNTFDTRFLFNKMSEAEVFLDIL